MSKDLEELQNRMMHLARSFHESGWIQQAEMLESILIFPTAGQPVVKVIADDRDRLKRLVVELHKGSCPGYREVVADFHKLEAEVKVLRGLKPAI